MKKEYKVMCSNGSDDGDLPIAVTRVQSIQLPGTNKFEESTIIDPILDWNVVNNLYGRIFTLVEATTESYKMKAVKDLFRKEIGEWHNEVHRSADEIVNGGNSGRNLYTRVLNSVDAG
jgi:hypothetical protein